MSRAKAGSRGPVARFATKSHKLTSQTFAWCLVCEFRRRGDAHTVTSQTTSHVATTGHGVRWDAFGAGIVLSSGVEPPGWPL